MSLRPVPSPLSLRVGHSANRNFIWDAIADNHAPGIRVSESLPIAVSQHLVSQAPVEHQVVITTSPDSWPGFPQFGITELDAAHSKVEALQGRADRSSLAVVVFDVPQEKWTVELTEWCRTLLRQCRSYGIYILVRGTTPDALDQPSDHELNVIAFPLILDQAPQRSFPEVVARHWDFGEWIPQRLVFDLETAAA